MSTNVLRKIDLESQVNLNVIEGGVLVSRENERPPPLEGWNWRGWVSFWLEPAQLRIRVAPHLPSKELERPWLSEPLQKWAVWR